MLVLLAALYMSSTVLLCVGGVLFAVGLIMSKVLTNIRVEARREVEYDEFGRSKSKGNYEKLSKAERDQIDLQKTARMEQVMSSSTIKKMTHPGSIDPQKDMDDMIGLSSVKSKMREMVARMEFDSQRKDQQTITNGISGRHMVFFGSPGTGKTTVARILTGFLHKYGYIEENKCVEVDGNFLKAGGDTATKTELVVRQAFGGVLFVDEAYSLMDSYVGKEAIATIIKLMEDHRDRFILILAGYTKEMRQLLDANPGFDSRIKEFLNFPDYDRMEMREIFIRMARSNGFSATDKALLNFDQRIENERRLPSFGNARTARNVLDESIDRHALNFMDGKVGEDSRYCLQAIDISVELKRNGF
jgi:stage V sporulation protein K